MRGSFEVPFPVQSRFGGLVISYAAQQGEGRWLM